MATWVCVVLRIASWQTRHNCLLLDYHTVLKRAEVISEETMIYLAIITSSYVKQFLWWSPWNCGAVGAAARRVQCKQSQKSQFHKIDKRDIAQGLGPWRKARFSLMKARFSENRPGKALRPSYFRLDKPTVTCL